MILAVTGHRPPRLGGYQIPNPIYLAVVEAIDKKLVELQPDTLIIGMALGVDQWTADLAILNDIPFIAAIPFPSFSSKWPDSSKREYNRLLGRASHVHMVSTTDEYAPALLKNRNRWMVSQAEALLAVWDGSPGGTGQAVGMASQMLKPIIRVELAPEIWTQAATEYRRIEQRSEAQLAIANEARMSVFRGQQVSPRFVFPRDTEERAAERRRIEAASIQRREEQARREFEQIRERLDQQAQQLAEREVAVQQRELEAIVAREAEEAEQLRRAEEQARLDREEARRQAETRPINLQPRRALDVGED